jgi:putative hydrolase of the HAD superfamily
VEDFMIKDFVFDLGNVLFEFKPENLVNKYITERDRAKCVYENIFCCKEWQELDLGTITEVEAIEAILKRIPEEGVIVEKIINEWHSILQPMEDNIELVRVLKSMGFRLLYLSNFHRTAFEKIFPQYDFFREFSGGVVSCYCQLLKPQAEIYEKLISTYNIIGDETVFIDDVQKNIDGARASGLNAILFQNPRQLSREMSKFGIIY